MTEVILAVNYQPHVMSSYMSEFEKELGIKISFSRETEPLGTGMPLPLPIAAQPHVGAGHHPQPSQPIASLLPC